MPVVGAVSLYGQNVEPPGAGLRFTVIVAVDAPSVTPTCCGVVIGAVSPVAIRVMVIVLPETKAWILGHVVNLPISFIDLIANAICLVKVSP